MVMLCQNALLMWKAITASNCHVAVRLKELSMHAMTGLAEALKWVLSRLLGSKTLVSYLRLDECGNA